MQGLCGDEQSAWLNIPWCRMQQPERKE